MSQESYRQYLKTWDYFGENIFFIIAPLLKEYNYLQTYFYFANSNHNLIFRWYKNLKYYKLFFES